MKVRLGSTGINSSKRYCSLILRPRKRLRHAVHLSLFNLFDPYGRYGRFNVVTDWSSCDVAVTDGLYWTDPLHHLIERSSHKDRKNQKTNKVNRTPDLTTLPWPHILKSVNTNSPFKIFFLYS